MRHYLKKCPFFVCFTFYLNNECPMKQSYPPAFKDCTGIVFTHPAWQVDGWAVGQFEKNLVRAVSKKV